MDKSKEVYNLLIMPIVSQKNKKTITMKQTHIVSDQTYYSGYDADMSDFAIGFYEIIYKDLYDTSSLLNKKGRLHNKEFAGDTMNSFNTIANRILGVRKSTNEIRNNKELWPNYLRDYHEQYHCLANFWLLPLEIGRTLRGQCNKARSPIRDYMDLFLENIHTQVSFTQQDREYFQSFRDWHDFCTQHVLVESYLDSDCNVILYSNPTNHTGEQYVTEAINRIKKRAEYLSKSTYVDELWNYFHSLNLL